MEMETSAKANTVPQVVKWMHEQVVLAHLDLAEFKRIYIENDEDLDLLNTAGQIFFVRLYHLYRWSFIQALGRVIYPKKSNVKGGPRANASLDHLVQESIGLPFEDRIRLLKREADGIWEPMKLIRDRMIAHSDLELALSETTSKMRAETVDIECIFTLAGECIKLFYLHYENGCKVSYGDTLHPPGAALMLKYLKIGKEAHDAEELALYGPL